MKNRFALFYFVLLLCLFSVTQPTTIHNITLTPSQEAYLQELTRVMKLKSGQLCTLCAAGKTLHYKNQTERDYEFKLTALKAEIEKLINQILELYRIIGLTEKDLEHEKKELHVGLCCYDEVTTAT